MSPAAWLLSLPYGVEILGQTQVDENTWTEVCATAIYCKDWETQRVRLLIRLLYHGMQE